MWHAELKMRVGPWTVRATGTSSLPSRATGYAVDACMDSLLDAVDRAAGASGRSRRTAAVPFAAFAPIGEDPK